MHSWIAISYFAAGETGTALTQITNFHWFTYFWVSASDERLLNLGMNTNCAGLNSEYRDVYLLF